MKYKDPKTGEYKDIFLKTGDTLPVGTIVEYDGDEVPVGYEEIPGVVASVVISPTEPTTGEEVWIDDVNKKMYTKDDNGDYKVFYDETNKEVYSTEEQRIGTWLGKPLYRKVVDFGALPNATSKQVAHGISNIDFITDIKATAALSGGDTLKLDVSDKDALKYSIHIASNNTNITIVTGSDRSSFTRCFVTLEYTKTTD